MQKVDTNQKKIIKSREPITHLEDLNVFLKQGSTDVVLFEINGDSGEEVEIYDGDWVMLDRERVPQKFDLVIMTDGENFSV